MDIGQYCHHLHHNDPYTMLGPFKLEQLSSQPYITVIHDMMYTSEMDHFKSYASDKLERSGHGDNNGSGGVQSLKRTSKQTWLEHRQVVVWELLSEKMSVSLQIQLTICSI